MTLVVLLRHGPTAGNREHRLQGRTDPPLDSAGRAAVARWRLPAFARTLNWRRSPLRRCAETAALLGLAAGVEPRLIEMDWGAWEGRALVTLRAEDPHFSVEEARGLDLTPPGGESPRQVQQRLAEFFRDVAADGADIGAICHKGIIRATLSLATGWNMIGKPPVRLRWDTLHLFRLNPAGELKIERLNCGLVTE
jgi:probable phosphoglycerate mutase